MAHVAFTPNLRRFVAVPPTEAPGDTVRAVLEHVFAEHPRARGYVLDDQGAVRKHMNIFVDDVQLKDRARLSDPVGDDSEIYVLQSLSGG